MVDIAASSPAPCPAATPRRSGRHSGRSGSAGLAARTLLATRRLKSGLSMVTRQSGFAATIARAVSPIRLQQSRQVADDGAETHQRDLCRHRTGLSARRLQVTPADADQLDRRGRSRLQRRDDIGAEQIARFLAGDDRHASAACAALTATVSRAGRSRKARARRPASITPAWSSTSERSASTPMPARPAACAAVTVGGPIAGRSARSSWPGLAHLTSTPRFLPASRPCERSALHALEQPIGALDALERDGAAADRHGGLADVERADRLGGGECGGKILDVAPVGFCGATLVSTPSVGQQIGDDLVRADDLDAAVLDELDQRRSSASSPWQPGEQRGSIFSSARLGLQRSSAWAAGRCRPPAPHA